MQEALEIINRVLAILARMSTAEAKAWVDVLENAQNLRDEGHENEQ